jgi:hypothetical protein
MALNMAAIVALDNVEAIKRNLAYLRKDKYDVFSAALNAMHRPKLWKPQTHEEYRDINELGMTHRATSY